MTHTLGSAALPSIMNAVRASSVSGGVVRRCTVTPSTSFRLASAADIKLGSSVAACSDASTVVTAETGV